MPHLLLDAMNFAILFALLIMCLGLPEEVRVIFYIPCAFAAINSLLVHKYTSMIIDKVTISQRARRSAAMLVAWLTFSIILMLPTLLLMDQMLVAMMSLLWAPQIV